MFIGSLAAGIINASKYIKCISLKNQQCLIQITLIDFHSNKYGQELHHYPFVVVLDRCLGSFDTVNDLPNRIYVPEKLNQYVLNINAEMNESKIINKTYIMQAWMQVW